MPKETKQQQAGSFDPFENLRPNTDNEGSVQSVNTDPFEGLLPSNTQETSESGTNRFDPFGGFDISLEPPEFAPKPPQDRPQIIEATLDPTSPSERHKNATQLQLTELNRDQSEEGQNKFFNAVDYSFDSIRANVLSLLGDDEGAEAIMSQSEIDNAERGGVGGFMGSALMGILPTVIASGVGLFAAPATATVAAGAALVYYATTSMGQAQRELHDYEEKTGEDIGFGMETVKTLGYGASALVFEALGLGTANKAARALGARNLLKVGKHFANKELKEASKIIAKEIPKTFHKAGMAEGAEEGLEQITNNVLTSLYDEQQKIADGLLESVAMGYFAGGVVGGSLQSVSGLSPKALKQAQAEIDVFVQDRADMVSHELGILKIPILQPSESQIVSSQIKPTGFREMTDISPLSVDKNAETAQVKSYITQVPTKVQTISYDLTNIEEELATETVVGTPQSQPLGLPLIQFESQEQANSKSVLEAKQQLMKILESEATEGIVIGEPGLKEEYRDSKLRGLKVIAAKMNRPFKVLGEALDVEYAWKAFPEVGSAIKNAFSVRVAYQKQGDFTIKQIGKLLADVNQREETSVMISVLANDSATKTSKAFNSLSESDQDTAIKGAAILREYMDNKKNELISNGVLKDGFYENYSKMLENRIARLIEQGKNEEALELQKQRVRIERDLKFVHIPYNLLFLDGHLTEPNTIRKMKYLARTKRKTLTIQDILNPVVDEKTGEILHEGFPDPNVLSFDNIIASYSDRMGKDMALHGILEAGETSGMIKNLRTEEGNKELDYDSGYTIPPALARGVLKGKQIDKKLAAWINENTLYQYNPNAFLKVLNFAKMVTFIQPAFLFMYDLVQGTYGGSLNYKTIFTGKNKKSPASRAWNSLKGYDTEMHEALKNGLEANILADSFHENVRRAVGYAFADGSKQGKMRQFYHQYLKANNDLTGLTNVAHQTLVNPLQAIYRSAFGLAWWGDSLARRMSYYTLRDQGMSVEQAAREAAFIHGSYSSVPSKSRKFLNAPFYTPTFKIVMGKYFARMTKDIVQGTKDYGDPAQKALETMMRLFILMAGQSALMRTLGFRETEFGRSYARTVKDNTGKTRDINVVWSAPHNMFLKYGYRALAASKNEKTNSLVHWFKSNRWELNPFWRVGYDVFVANRSAQTGKPIWNKSDDFQKRTFDKIEGVLEGAFPLVRGGSYLVGNDANRIAKRDINYIGKGYSKRDLQLLKVITNVPFNFLYMSDPGSMKIIDNINAISERIGRYEVYDPNLMTALSPSEKTKMQQTQNRINAIRVQNDLEKIEKLLKELKALQGEEKANFKKNLDRN